MGHSLSILSSAWNEILGYNIFDVVAPTRSIRMAIRTSSFKRQDSGATKELARSVSFKEWDAISEPSPSSSTAVPLRKKGHIESITKPTIQLPEQPFVFCSPKPKPEVGEDAKPFVFVSPKPKTELDEAATKVQKVYKSYRTRRNLADCAVLVEELWWKALDSAALKRLSVSFFDIDKKETAASRWTRATARLAKVGKGLSKDENAQKLALQHWLEAIDARHRYGHNLHLYYDVWSASMSTQPFFYWLDVGDGKEVNHEKCPRQRLQSQCITYLGPKERQVYEVIVDSGKLVYHHDGRLLHTEEGSKWIFVLSTSRTLFVGQKKKGNFQHSSFLSGAAITAAGRLVARDGVLEAIWPYSGHYLPTEDNFNEFISFLEQNKLDLTNVKRCAVDDDDASSNIVRAGSNNSEESKDTVASVILNAIEANKETSIADANRPAFDESKRLSCKWTSGVGPRIGCVSDYPAELRFQALEQVSLSPRVTPGRVNSPLPIPSPRPSPKIRVSPRLACMGLPSPRVQVAC